MLSLDPETSRAARIERLIGYTGLPARYRAASFETWVERRGTGAALRAAQAWAAAPILERGLFFVGPPGTGKTHLLAAAVLAKVQSSVAGIRWANVPLLLDRLRAAQRYTDSDSMESFAYMRDEARVVVLDDLGKERATDWATERLYVLVEARYGALRPTLASTNRSLDELAEAGYGALVSRLTETCEVVRLEASDYRVTGR
ncbi:MAG: hypothetical protein C0498_01580 [Anaerolinea sp.]|nr:hypothetical protein [Anaerolinea sp.]